MRRVASLYLPHFAIERLRRAEPSFTKRPEARPPAELPVDDDPGACSVPRGGGWRPGARWARADIDAQIAALPAHRRPLMRELGRRSEAAAHPFRSATGHASAVTGNATPVDDAAVRPLILTERIGRQCLVTAACPLARQLGLNVGMPAAQAQALIADLDIRLHDRPRDEQVLGRFALHAATHWTPIAMATRDGLLLDLAGTSHLFGGEKRFCARVLSFCRRLGLTAAIAISDTPGAAHALSRYAPTRVTIVTPGGTAQAIAQLPIAALRLDDHAIDAARRFGLVCIGDLLGLPRAPLARRLGRSAIERLDQALGRTAEPLHPVTPIEAVIAQRRLLEPVSTAEAIAQVSADLVGDLVAQLRAGGLGARAVRLSCQRVDGTEQHLAFGTARATREAPHLLRLITLRIDRIDPGFGIEAMSLHALRVDTLAAKNLGAVLAGDEPARDVADVIDQLAGRVGDASIFRVGPIESDVPERAVEKTGPLCAPLGWPPYRRPIRLLPRPEQVFGVVALLPDAPPRRFEWRGTMHRVVAADGPERIHGEWWRRAGEVWAVRDYFRVEDDAGGRFWLFRRGDGIDVDTGDLTWYMHGVFG